MKPLEPSLPGESRSEYLAREDAGLNATIDEVAKWLHDETEHPDSYPDHTWPETDRDDGQREGGFVKIVPKHGQAYFRDIARRLVARFEVVPKNQNENLANLVKCFSTALLGKLRRAEVKYGRKDDWLSPDWESDCQRKLLEHVAKGDPLDVAAYAAFCWHHGWKSGFNSSEVNPGQSLKPPYPVSEADKKLAADWYTWGFQSGIEAEKKTAARRSDSITSVVGSPPTS